MEEDPSNQAHQVRRLIPVPQFNKYHPDPSPGAIRWMIFKNTRGFRRCVVRRGKRVLIDEVEYFKWLDENNQNEH